MSVEAIFWFHPLVWWTGKQMILERERACDEEVLRCGADAESYAEGILKVCRFYLESPVACAAGVTGADLKNRIQQIMTNRMPPRIDFGRKLLLTAAGLAAIASPVTIGMLNAPRLRAQPADKLAFEVASVKENKSGDRQIQMQFLPGGKFVARNMPLWVILTTALNLPFNTERITGQPEWVMGTRYDIEAGAPAGLIPPGASLPLRTAKTLPMLETLLEDRFKLKIRRQISEGAVYFIAVAKGGLKLQKSARDEKACIDATSDFGNSAACHSFGGGQGRGIHGEAASLSDLAAFVSNFADRPVIDKTGLAGLYKFETEGWAPMHPHPPRPPDQEPSEEEKRFGDPSTPTLFTIFDRLGLKLESSKAPVETFVVENIERPTGNW
jgi:bla regulator protein BlaR1